MEGAACFGELLREELGEAVVAVVDAEEAVAFDGLFGGLLEAEGAGADDAVVGGVEAFDVADGGAALVFGDGVLGEVFGEGEVGAGEGFESCRGWGWPPLLRRGTGGGRLRR